MLRPSLLLLLLALVLVAACSTNETVKRVKGLADKACACTDAACADAVEKEYVDLVKEGQKRGSDDDRDEVAKSYSRMRDCIASARTGGEGADKGEGGDAVSDFVAELARHRATAILRTDSQSVAAAAMEAAVRGGFRHLEFTLTTPGALELVAEFSRRPELIVGTGTVLTVDDARRSVRAGARFLVSPVMDEDVIRAAIDLGQVAIPGCHTPTEMLRAHRAGAQLQKLFPAPAGGPEYVRAVLAPMPFLRLLPTNGVNGDNAADYLAAGAVAVGFVSSLFEASDLAGGRYDRIEERARAFLAAVRAP